VVDRVVPRNATAQLAGRRRATFGPGIDESADALCERRSVVLDEPQRRLDAVRQRREAVARDEHGQAGGGGFVHDLVERTGTHVADEHVRLRIHLVDARSRHRILDPRAAGDELGPVPPLLVGQRRASDLELHAVEPRDGVDDRAKALRRRRPPEREQAQGTFGRPPILSQTGGKFIRHPIPQDVWDAATNNSNSGSPVEVYGGAPSSSWLQRLVAAKIVLNYKSLRCPGWGEFARTTNPTYENDEQIGYGMRRSYNYTYYDGKGVRWLNAFKVRGPSSEWPLATDTIRAGNSYQLLVPPESLYA